jgi:hypothetical protein
MSETFQNADARITIDRWRNTYLVAGGLSARQGAMQDAFGRIDRCIAEELPACCARRLGERFDRESSAVWRISKIDLSFDVDISAPPGGNPAEVLSEAVAFRIAEIIDRGESSDEILHFPDRAAYQSQFARDLAAGRAWSKWYYEEFHSLAALSTGRAIREMLTREPQEGVRTLLYLAASGRLDEILAVLTDADAEAVYKQCFGSAEGLNLPAPTISHSSKTLALWSGRLLDTWNEAPMCLPGSSQKNFHVALRWLARAALRFPGAEFDPAASAALDGLLEVRRLLAAIGSPLLADRVVRGLVQQQMSIEEAIGIALKEDVAFKGELVAKESMEPMEGLVLKDDAVSGENGLRFLFQIAQGDVDWATQAVAALLRDQLPASQAIVAGESILTLFGGIFLLGPALLKINDSLELAAADGERTAENASFLRYLVLAKCLGSGRALEAMSDPALRLLSGCRQACLQDGRQPGLQLNASLTPATIARGLIEKMGCESRCLLAEAIRPSSQADEILILRDLARNEWIYATLLPQERAAREAVLIAAIDRVQESSGNTSYLLLHSSLLELAQSQALRSRVHRLLALDREDAGSEAAKMLVSAGCVSVATPQGKIAHLLGSAEDEFAHLFFGNPWPDFNLALDLVSALLARAALKEFARRLMGLQASSPEHLCRNFLEGVGTIRTLPERIEVELPRSPLSLVLQLSGLSTQTYTVPWLEGREVCLLPWRE